MSNSQNCELLNRMVAILSSSLPNYLSSARPWSVTTQDDAALETLDDIVQDQQELVNRAADVINQRRGVVLLGEFPMEFTDLHDLSVDYLLERTLSYQQTDIGDLEAIAETIQADRGGEALVREAIGAAKGHLDSLRELIASRKIST